MTLVLLLAGGTGTALLTAAAAPHRAAEAVTAAVSACPVWSSAQGVDSFAYAPFQMLAPGVGWEWSSQDRLLWTADGGARWRDITPPAGPLAPAPGGPASACFVTPDDGWVAAPLGQPGSTDVQGPAGVVWHTTDGGATWRAAPLPIPLAAAAPASMQLDFVSPLDGYLLFEPTALADGPTHPTLLRTNDGGADWSPVPLVVGHGPGTGPMRFVSAQLGWSHQPELVSTDDGGASWRPVHLPGVPVGCHLTAGLPTFWSATAGVLPATYGGAGGRAPCEAVGRPAHLVLYATRNGGRTWSVRSSRRYTQVEAGTVPRLAVVNADDWAAVVGPATWPNRGHSPRGILWWTHDGGRQWTTLTPRGLWWYFLADAAELQFTDTTEGWAYGCPPLGPCQVFATPDGGGSWHALPPGPLLTATGPPPTPAVPVADAPRPAACPYPSGGYQSAPFQMLSARAGWVWSGTDRLLWTADGGRTWRDITPPAHIPYAQSLETSTCFVSRLDGWVAVPAAGGPETHGRAGTVWRTTDGGRTWRPATLSTTLAHGPALILQLNFVNRLDGWLMDQTPSPGMGAPSPAYLFRTSDGGVRWTRASWPKGGAAVGRLRFYEPALGVAEGRPLSITRDGGRTWTEARLPLPAGARGCDLSGGLPQFWSAAGGVAAVVFSSPTAGIPAPAQPCANPPDRVALYTTTDGGATWTLATVVAPGTSYPTTPDLLVTDRTDWVLVEGSILLETHDAGVRWSFIIPAGMPVAGGALTQFADQAVGWASGCDGSVQWCGTVYVTVDGGQVWRPLPVTLAPTHG